MTIVGKNLTVSFAFALLAVVFAYPIYLLAVSFERQQGTWLIIKKIIATLSLTGVDLIFWWCALVYCVMPGSTGETIFSYAGKIMKRLSFRISSVLAFFAAWAFYASIDFFRKWYTGVDPEMVLPIAMCAFILLITGIVLAFASYKALNSDEQGNSK